MKKIFTLTLVAMLLCCGISVNAGTYSIKASSGFLSSYSNDEKTFSINDADDANAVTIGYISCMYNTNGSPEGWAGGKDNQQLIQTKKSAGKIYNTTAIEGLSKIIIKAQNAGKGFTINYGTGILTLTTTVASSTITPTKESITYTGYANKQPVPNQTAEIDVYTFDLSNKGATYFSFENGSGAGCIYEVVIEYTTKTVDPTAPALTADKTELDFGAIEEGNAFETQTLTLTGANLTDATLFEINGTNAASFKAEGELTETGGTLTITCTATEIGVYEANLYIIGDDDIELNIPLKAKVIVIEGEGTKEKPYTVNDVLALNNSVTGDHWVIGYIIGAAKYIKDAPAEVEGKGATTETNIVLGATADTELGTIDATKHVAIQLVKGDARTNLNVVAHPENIGKKVKVYGSLEAYFGVPGVKNVETTAHYEIVEQGPSTICEDIEVEAKAVKMIENGQLIIVRKGVKYNAQGAVIE